MKCNIISNETDRSNEALRVLLLIAWHAARGDSDERPINFKFAYTRRSLWRCRYSNFGLPATILIRRGDVHGNIAGIECRNFNEVFVGLTAWTIANLHKTRDVHLAASEAIYAAKDKGADLEQAMAAADGRKEERQRQAFAREVMRNMQKNSLEFKLKRIEAQEKIWLRKTRLAATKLKGLRRRRASLIAADKRKNEAFEPVV